MLLVKNLKCCAIFVIYFRVSAQYPSEKCCNECWLHAYNPKNSILAQCHIINFITWSTDTVISDVNANVNVGRHNTAFFLFTLPLSSTEPRRWIRRYYQTPRRYISTSRLRWCFSSCFAYFKRFQILAFLWNGVGKLNEECPRALNQVLLSSSVIAPQ